MQLRYEIAGQTTLVQVESAGDGYAVTVAGCTYQVRASAPRAGEIDLEVDGQHRCLAYVATDGASRWVALASGAAAGQAFLLTVADAGRRPRRAQDGGHEALEAQMPGIVRRVLVAEGQPVTRGQALVLLEAMKMEIRVTAPHAGVVERVAVAEGQAVERGQALVELSNLSDGPARSTTQRS